jgi:inhibitor of KinA
MQYTIETLGEDALLLRFGDAVDAAVNARVHALSRQIERVRPPWLHDLVPAYASLALFVDADAFDCRLDPLAEAGRWLQQQGFAGGDAETADRLIEIPVQYGNDDGPDLAALATHAGLGEDEVIARHCAVEYRVAMLGFSPGFPYLLGLDPRLAMARLDTPRTRVPAGSVGIGGAQTGIYPQAGPGGWRIIGRTTLTLFDPLHDPPTLLAPGDRVRFVAA